ncbi:hypothetical protein FOG50_02876 [Hanseniaspora uvarum]|nr:hypothetical protein FOG50_02876 [Hanseniaspora uvarum]
MFSGQVQAKRFLKAKIRLPTPHSNHKVNEFKLKEYKKNETIIPLFSHTNSENNKTNYLPDFKNLEEFKLPYEETQLSNLYTSLSTLFGQNLVVKNIPKNLLVSEKYFNGSRLPQPFIRYSNNQEVERTGNNAHFNAIGENYINFIKEKYALEQTNLNKISDLEPTAVLGFLYLTNYNAGNSVDFESKLLQVLKN